jgi:hypothetical protein
VEDDFWVCNIPVKENGEGTGEDKMCRERLGSHSGKVAPVSYCWQFPIKNYSAKDKPDETNGFFSD